MVFNIFLEKVSSILLATKLAMSSGDMYLGPLSWKICIVIEFLLNMKRIM